MYLKISSALLNVFAYKLRPVSGTPGGQKWRKMYLWNCSAWAHSTVSGIILQLLRYFDYFPMSMHGDFDILLIEYAKYTSNSCSLWWANLGWVLGAHQASSLLLSAWGLYSGQKNYDGKEFIGQGSVKQKPHMVPDGNFSTSPQQVMSSQFSGSRTLVHVIVALENQCHANNCCCFSFLLAFVAEQTSYNTEYPCGQFVWTVLTIHSQDLAHSQPIGL